MQQGAARLIVGHPGGITLPGVALRPTLSLTAWRTAVRISNTRVPAAPASPTAWPIQPAINEHGVS